tara:strand:+ start:49 stop:1158 length:1110 start_codon:yes stop_codon:yes gene_type:complete
MANGNGWASQLAAFRTGQGTGFSRGLFDLGSKAIGDLRIIEKLEEQYNKDMKERGKTAEDAEVKRGWDRIKGALIGASLGILTGGGSLAIGALTGLGSYVGQKAGRGGVTWKTPLGRKKTLKAIAKGTADTLFHSRLGRKVEQKREDLNEKLKEWDRQFDESIIASSLSDALMAYQAGSIDWKTLGKQIGNLRNLPSVAKGELTWDQYKNLINSKSTFGKPPLPNKLSSKITTDQAKLAGDQLLSRMQDPTAMKYEKPSELLKRFGRSQKGGKPFSITPGGSSIQRVKEIKKAVEGITKTKAPSLAMRNVSDKYTPISEVLSVTDRNNLPSFLNTLRNVSNPLAIPESIDYDMDSYFKSIFSNLKSGGR